MLSPLLIGLITLLVLVCRLYGRPQRKDFVQISVIAGFMVALNTVSMAGGPISDIAFATEPLSPRPAHAQQDLLYCDEPITTAEKNSLGCSGGCVSDPSIKPENVCHDAGQKECIGSLKQKIQRISAIFRARRSAYRVDDSNFKINWPARGRIIQEFANGGDGINIALAEGTQVKAVEEGEVAFAGGELKGYGKMILIRHPNGYVSAYAHNSELKVVRGDKVMRGQVIALSGQTGNVGSPQLHFELRKGSTPVDPAFYLAGL